MVDGSSDDDIDIDIEAELGFGRNEELEDMFDSEHEGPEERERRREALERRRSDGDRVAPERRLSRELEEGFRDDSDDESSDTADERGRRWRPR